MTHSDLSDRRDGPCEGEGGTEERGWRRILASVRLTGEAVRSRGAVAWARWEAAPWQGAADGFVSAMAGRRGTAVGAARVLGHVAGVEESGADGLNRGGVEDRPDDAQPPRAVWAWAVEGVDEPDAAQQVRPGEMRRYLAVCEPEAVIAP